MHCANYDRNALLERLSKEIEELRQHLSSLHERNRNNTHPEILTASRTLDRKIMEYFQLLKDS